MRFINWIRCLFGNHEEKHIGAISNFIAVFECEHCKKRATFDYKTGETNEYVDGWVIFNE